MRSILVTGGTGMLGSALLPALDADRDLEIFVLAHGSSNPGAARLWSAGLRTRTVRVVRGDISLPDLGLGGSARAEISSRVDGILHAAALTAFGAPLDESRRVNVRGTRNVLAFARSCARLDRLAFVSTVYVSGTRTGTIFERDASHDAFVNSYERAKYEAEAAVRSSGLPAAIYRLSTLIGDLADGATTRFTAPHQALRLMYLGLASMVAGRPDCPIDLLPTDAAARTVAALFLRGPASGTFHVVSGPDRSFTLEEIIEASWEALARTVPAWRQRTRPRPVIVRPEVFDEAIRATRDAGNVLLLNAFGTIASYCAQFSHPKRFDDTELRRVVPEHARALPHAREYYRRVVEYCVRTDWGHRAV